MTDEQYTDILNSCGGNISLRDAQLLYQTAIDADAKIIVEIGSREGCSSMVLGHVAKETGGHLWCIEPMVRSKWTQNMTQHGLLEYATMMKAVSPWIPDADFWKAVIPIDYLFIDGDHRTRWTIVDYHFWEHFVKEGGIIAFHDWTGAKGVGKWVQRAVNIILEDDSKKLEEVCRNESTDRGIIIFKKISSVVSMMI